MAQISRGNFLGDYQGLTAAGNSFYALFAEAGSGSSDPSNIWFRDPPPAAVESPVASAASTPGAMNLHNLPAWGIGDFARNLSAVDGAGFVPGSERSSVVDKLPPMVENLVLPTKPAGQLANIPLSSGDDGMVWVADGEALLDAVFSDPGDIA